MIQAPMALGSLAITYLARDTLNRRVVIRECFPDTLCRRSGRSVFARNPARAADFRAIVELFLCEAAALARAAHPNIAGIRQAFEENATAYLVLEHIEGDRLEDLIGSAELTPARVETALRKVLDALGCIHAQGLLHHDISPENILIDRRTGEPTLIGFGDARERASRINDALPGPRAQRQGYAPKEFHVDGNDEGPSGDLYALAATFYHVITGTPPPPSQLRLFAVATGEADTFVPLLPAQGRYPAPFVAAINRCLSLLPRDRIQSARAWLRAIAPEAAPGAGPTPAAPDTTGSPNESAAGAAQAALERAAAVRSAQGAAARKPKAAPAPVLTPIVLVTLAVALAAGLAVAFGAFTGGARQIAVVVDTDPPTMPGVALAPIRSTVVRAAPKTD